MHLLLEKLAEKRRFGIKPSLQHCQSILKALGSIDKTLCTTLVAGTNGKGSTCHYLGAILQANGHRVGFFSSPHLIHLNERIRINNIPLSEAELLKFLQIVESYAQKLGLSLTFFESLTLMATLAFAEAKVDYALFEAGLGGRWDATNALHRQLQLITPIGFDHQKILGHTLKAIATEKAGIIAPYVQVISAPQSPEALEVLKEVAFKQHAPLKVLTQQQVALSTYTEGLADFQYCNQAVAAEAASYFHIDKQIIADGLQHAAPWIGRYQWLQQQPLLQRDLLLDGAHNISAMQTLSDCLKKCSIRQQRPLELLYGCCADKDSMEILDILIQSNAIQHVHLCPLQNHRSLDIKQLINIQQRLFSQYTLASTIHKNSTDALIALKQSQKSDTALPLLATGSLYLLAEILASLNNEPYYAQLNDPHEYPTR